MSSVAWEIEHEQSSYLCLDKDDMDDRYQHGGGVFKIVGLL